MALTAQLVDSISDAATVRLDLNEHVTWEVIAKGTSTPPPPLRRVVVASPMADGDLYPSDRYGNRTVTLALNLLPDGLDDAAAAVQTLMRELDRPAGYLRWQPHTTKAVYFRLARGEADVRWDQVARRVTVRVPAAPYAYGPRETLAQVTVSNDPNAIAANGHFFDVAGVKGDVPAPLILTVDGADVNLAGGRRTTAVGARRRGNPAAMPPPAQVESASMLTNDTALFADAAMSAGACARTTFATVTGHELRARWSAAYPPAGPFDDDYRGLYRWFARTRHSVAGDTITLQLKAKFANTTVSGDLVTLPATTAIRWVDLGLMSIPFGPDPVDDGSGVVLPAYRMDMELYAGRTGTGTLDVDVLEPVPADDSLLFVKWPVDGAGTWVIDSERQIVYALHSITGAVFSTPGAETGGGWPMASPGVTNRYVWIKDAGNLAGATGDDKTGSTRITPAYFPRYLHVRPVSS